MSHEQWCLDQVLSARWYAGKDVPARLAGVTALAWWIEPGPDRIGVRSEIVELEHPHRRSHYHLLLAYGPGDAGPRDATLAAADRAALWQGLGRARDRKAATLHVRLVTPLPEVSGSQRFEGQQSNTSVLYGDASVLKVFRQLWPGHNPDVEVHDRLTRRRSTRTADLQVVVRATWLPASAGPHDAPLRGDLAMVLEQFPGARDGWSLACDEPDLLDPGALGEALGEVHALLSRVHGLEQVDGAEIAARLRERIERHVGAAEELAPMAEALRAATDLGPDPIPVMRIHGDAHLGQALLTAEDEWKLIDFEGEPGVPISRRVAPDSPARDVAGFLRSFSYAAAMHGRTPEALERLRTWRQDFLTGWRRTAPVEVGPALLRVHELERAAYEVTYEKAARPDWLAIPLEDVVRLTQEAP